MKEGVLIYFLFFICLLTNEAPSLTNQTLIELDELASVRRTYAIKGDLKGEIKFTTSSYATYGGPLLFNYDVIERTTRRITIKYTAGVLKGTENYVGLIKCVRKDGTSTSIPFTSGKVVVGGQRVPTSEESTVSQIAHTGLFERSQP